MFTMIMISSAPVIANASSVPVSTGIPVKSEDPRVTQLMERLAEIKRIDKSSLSRIEKRELRKEVKDIRKEMRTISRGVYLSVGAIIIIILLLILLL